MHDPLRVLKYLLMQKKGKKGMHTELNAGPTSTRDYGTPIQQINIIINHSATTLHSLVGQLILYTQQRESFQSLYFGK
jgi:hypothetical protein